MRLVQGNGQIGTVADAGDKPRTPLNSNSEQNNNSQPSTNKTRTIESSGVITVSCGEDKVPLIHGSFLLARWYDDLYYPALLVKVKPEDECCLVQFDDGTQVTVPVNYVQWPALPTDKEIRCSLCHYEHSRAPNQIVLCDDCGLGFHQRCHHPVISEETLKANTDWYCCLCLLKRHTKLVKNYYGDKGKCSNGLIQRSNTKMCKPKRRVLPYKLSTLHWTESHCQNQERTYCYCGASGLWFLKMVQCTRCKQWFHEACLTAKPGRPQTCGDTAYLFLCSLCNGGQELLHRIDLRWSDIAHVALFNLSMGGGKYGKYADFDTDLMPWINNRWENLNVGKLEPTGLKERFMDIVKALRDDNVKFKNGSENKKRVAWYALRVRCAPFVPVVKLPTEQRTITPAVLRDWLAPTTDRVFYLPPSSIAVSVPNLFQKTSALAGKKRKRSLENEAADTSESRPPQCKKKRTSTSLLEDRPANLKPLKLNGKPLKLNGKPKPLKLNGKPLKLNGKPLKLNGIHPTTKEQQKQKPSPSVHTTSAQGKDSEKVAKKKKSRKTSSLLSREIPVLSDYSGLNNPLLYDFEVEAATAKYKARCQQLNVFTSGLPSEEHDASSDSVNTKTQDNHTKNQDNHTNHHKNNHHRNGLMNGLRSRESSAAFMNGFANVNGPPDNSLERCIYEGDALEWDEFQVRGIRTADSGDGGTVTTMYTEYYADMPELKMKL